MPETAKSEKSSNFLPIWVYIVSLLVVVLSFSSMLWAHAKTNESSWLQYIFLVPFYMSLQIVGEGFLSMFWETKSWLAKVIPIAVIIAFYAI
jgi:hypothetical protein